MLYVLAWQCAVPLVQPLHSILPLVVPLSTSPSPIQLLPPTIYAFPLTPEVHTSTQSDQVPVTCTPTWQSSMPLIEASHLFLPPALETLAPHSRVQPPMQLPQAFPRLLQFYPSQPADPGLIMHAQTLQQHAPLTNAPRNDL
jgi:hypothetical protein